MGGGTMFSSPDMSGLLSKSLIVFSNWEHFRGEKVQEVPCEISWDCFGGAVLHPSSCSHK